HQAQSLLEPLVARHPDKARYRQELARIYHFLGWLHNLRDKQEEAEHYNRQVLALREGLVRDFPGVGGYREDLGYTLNNILKLEGDLGRPHEAEEVYVRLLPLWQTLAADFPTLPEYGSMVGLAHFNLAQVLLKRRDPASLTRCRGLLNQAVEAQLAAL